MTKFLLRIYQVHIKVINLLSFHYHTHLTHAILNSNTKCGRSSLPLESFVVFTVFFKGQTLNKYALMMSRGGSATIESSAHSNTGAFECSDNRSRDV